jgi:hypothetical protein
MRLRHWQVCIPTNVKVCKLIKDIVNVSTTISTTPTVTSPPTNTGDACAVSWIDWLENRLSFSLQTSRSVIYGEQSSLYTTTGHVKTLATPKVRIITSTSYQPMPTQCDGMPRVTQIGEYTLTRTYTTTSIRSLTFIGNSSYQQSLSLASAIPWNDDDSFWRNTWGTAPVCRIAEDRCSEAWEGLRTAMKRYVPMAQEIFEWTLANPDLGQASEIIEMRKNATWTNHTIMGNILIDEFLTIDLNDNFMGGCLEPRITFMSRCWNFFAESIPQLETSGLPREEVITSLGEDTGCALKPDKGVLMYFPPKKAKATRDLCANSNWGDDPLPATIDGPPETAVVTEVVFSAHTFFSNDPDNTKLWESFPHWKPESTMKGRWTMTAGSVYLAINTMQIYHACNWRPFELFSDILLTMSTTDLSSLVLAMSPTKLPLPMTDLVVSRSFNLLDLEGPVPLNPWQASDEVFLTSFTITDGHYEPRISLPSALADYNPRFKSCIPFYLNPRFQFFGLQKNAYVWDPPITLEGTPVKIATQTTMPEASPSSPALSQLPPMTTAAQNSPPGVKITSTVVIVGSKTVTLGYQQIDPSGILIGGNTLRAGGPAMTTDTFQVSLAPGNLIIVGGSVIVPIAAPTTAPASGTPISQASPMNLQSLEGIAIRMGTMTDGRPGIIVGGSTTIAMGQAVTVGSKTLNYGTNGILSEGDRPVTTVTITPIAGGTEDSTQSSVSTSKNSTKSTAAIETCNWGLLLSLLGVCNLFYAVVLL